MLKVLSVGWGKIKAIEKKIHNECDSEHCSGKQTVIFLKKTDMDTVIKFTKNESIKACEKKIC